MKHVILTLVLISFGTINHAIIYDEHEIQGLYTDQALNDESTALINNYLTAKQPQNVIDEFIAADLIPLQKEYMLSQFLDFIATQPPQPSHRTAVETLKSFQSQADIMHPEGRVPAAIFNIRHRAHGIENIWLAAATEARFHDLFQNNLKQALLEAPNNYSNPHWLAMKNAVSRLNTAHANQLIHGLLTSQNPGLDRLAGHVGLQHQHQPLLEKALHSKEPSVRQHILRNLSTSLKPETAKAMLLTQAQNGSDRQFVTPLLSTFNQDPAVQAWLVNQLGDAALGSQAAFALSQHPDQNLWEQLRLKHLKSQSGIEQKNIVLALQLNPDERARLLLDGLPQNLQSENWLKTHAGDEK